MEEQSILFFVEPTPLVTENPQGARDGRDTGGDFGTPKRDLVDRLQGHVSLPVERLRRQVGELVTMVAEVFDRAEQQAGVATPDRQLQLEEIELTVEVNGEGQLGILGSGGKAGGKGGIKLKFTRKSS
jgi:hypothetical protein